MKKVVVFGSYVADLTSRQRGLPAPGETIRGDAFQIGPGGKGSNQAVAAHRAGADVTLITKIGDDVFGHMALDFYAAQGMTTHHILVDSSLDTGVALIMVDTVSAQNEIVVVPGACGQIIADDVERCRTVIESADILLVQLEVNFDALWAVIDIAHAAGVTVVLNPAPAAPIPEEMFAKIDIITPNETEALSMTGIAVHSAADAQRAATALHAKGIGQVVLTLGAMGAFASDGTQTAWVDRLPVDAIDTTGAGDAFNGGFVTALAAGHDLFTALRYGNVTGALSVTRHGTAPAMPSRAEIDALYAQHYGSTESNGGYQP